MNKKRLSLTITALTSILAISTVVFASTMKSSSVFAASRGAPTTKSFIFDRNTTGFEDTLDDINLWGNDGYEFDEGRKMDFRLSFYAASNYTFTPILKEFNQDGCFVKGHNSAKTGSILNLDIGVNNLQELSLTFGVSYSAFSLSYSLSFNADEDGFEPVGPGIYVSEEERRTVTINWNRADYGYEGIVRYINFGINSSDCADFCIENLSLTWLC